MLLIETEIKAARIIFRLSVGTVMGCWKDGIFGSSGTSYLCLHPFAGFSCIVSQELLWKYRARSGQYTTGIGSLHLHWLLLEGRWLCSLLARVKLSHKLFAYLLLVEAGLVQPRVSLELIDCVAVRPIVAKELENHVLEVSREASAIDLLEVGFDLTGQEQVVEILFLAGFFEWEDALYDNEDDDTDGE